MISFQNVSKIYSPSAIALQDVSFEIQPNEFISIVGQSGAGKTTLLKLLLAEEKPSEGKVYFDSVDVHSVKLSELHNIRKRIGSVFQDYRLLERKTAFENIAFALEAAGEEDEKIEVDVLRVLELVGLPDKVSRFPEELSAGERQRVAIARAIINQPDVIIADEPTGNLDPLNTREIIDLLLKINELGTTMILTTHNHEIVNSLGRRVITLENGKVARDEKEGKYII